MSVHEHIVPEGYEWMSSQEESFGAQRPPSVAQIQIALDLLRTFANEGKQGYDYRPDVREYSDTNETHRVVSQAPIRESDESDPFDPYQNPIAEANRRNPVTYSGRPQKLPEKPLYV